MSFVEVSHPECLVWDLGWDKLGVVAPHMMACDQQVGNVALVLLDVKAAPPSIKVKV